MTYQDDPNINARQRRIDAERKNNTPMWIAGAVALAVVIALVGYSVSTSNAPSLANNRPVATERSTTGSGAVTPIPNNQKGTAPQRDSNQPAPAAPATDR